MLDQFLVNKNMAKTNSPIRIKADTVQIVAFPDMVDDGDYPKPIRFGGMGKAVDQNGFSDHFPITVEIEEAD